MRFETNNRRVEVPPLHLRDHPVHRPVTEISALERRGHFLQEGASIAGRQRLRGSHHSCKLIIGEAKGGIGRRCGRRWRGSRWIPDCGRNRDRRPPSHMISGKGALQADA